MIRRTSPPERRAWRLAPFALVLSCLAVVTVAGCGSSGGSGDPGDRSGQTLTLYNAQHEETTAALIKAFTEQTGIKVRVKSDDESVLTAQIEQEGSRSPADVFFTENSNWLQQLDDRGLLAKVNASTLAAVPAEDSAANGDWVGVSGRFSVMIYNPSKISAAQLPTSVMDLANPQVQGQARAGSRGDRLLADRHLDRARQGPGGGAELAEGDQVERRLRRPHARQRDARHRRQQGRRRHGSDQPLLLLPPARRDGRGQLPRQAVAVRASRSRLRRGHLGRGDPEVVEEPGGGAAVPRVPDQRRRPARARRQHSFEYPLARGVAPNPALPPVEQRTNPTRSRPAQIGTGTDAQKLLQQAGLI